jgi:hypothetical protein
LVFKPFQQPKLLNKKGTLGVPRIRNLLRKYTTGERPLGKNYSAAAAVAAGKSSIRLQCFPDC